MAYNRVMCRIYTAEEMEKIMEITFKAVEKPDIAMVTRILYIEQEAFGEGALNEYTVVPLMHHGKAYVAVDEEDDAIACAYFIRSMNDIDVAYLMSIAVLPVFRGQDIGTELLSYAFSHLKRFDIASVQLVVDPANFKALSTYREKLGFTVVDRDEYDAGEDRLVMTKEL